MAVHSFPSIAEIYTAPTEEEREKIREKILQESKTFDIQLRKALARRHAAERRAELLKLESLYEFKRSHPTVEVSSIHDTFLDTQYYAYNVSI